MRECVFRERLDAPTLFLRLIRSELLFEKVAVVLVQSASAAFSVLFGKRINSTFEFTEEALTLFGQKGAKWTEV